MIMAACGSLQSMLDNRLSENPTIWNLHKPMKPVEPSSLAEILGEIYFHEKTSDTVHSTLSPPPTLDDNPQSDISKNVQPKSVYRCDSKRNGSLFPTKNSESLQMCTEGLGSESSDDVDDLLESGDDWRSCEKGEAEIRKRPLMYSVVNGYSSRGCWDAKTPIATKIGREFPPPISSIGSGGKPRVCLKSYRENGRFVLRETRIPTQELLHACREDGRLKLCFVHPKKDIVEDDDDDDDDDGEQEVEEEEINDDEQKKLVKE